ncbi:MAG: hypothetical protein A3C12_00645 [Candidatus Sungbacteria bacterium RIFCSPHIGHO2_02_FULL_49_20]|uniref:Uncharacterized protein n=1 Tax=Candidatus Sungbacteria bacterium RIFCSPHIGHO2_02_FULL_49_20 TaxID=1802272 RepID=A0A1G2KNQ4_9BACT|nr:MAG: hypothetical protein A3C12_00645 [Candidatus Sungbacteria bacterium RIFCSPHIGHO2_02_FULL_49_20]
MPKGVQKVFDKQLVHLLRDIRYPSLRAKKYDESRNLWQARVTGRYRFYFEIRNDFYILHEVRPHKE